MLRDCREIWSEVFNSVRTGMNPTYCEAETVRFGMSLTAGMAFASRSTCTLAHCGSLESAESSARRTSYIFLWLLRLSHPCKHTLGRDTFEDPLLYLRGRG